MKTHVFLFQDRFAQAVLDGKKTQTIRTFRKRIPRSGDLIDLREWLGLPYRSPMVRLAIAPCLSVSTVRISHSEINVGHLSGEDGFAILDQPKHKDYFADMVKWFESTHQLPFLGMRVQWGKFIVQNAHSVLP
jgi:hypothetical protein